MHHPITKTRFEPTEIAPETYLIHDHQGEGVAPVCVALNAMVIRGEQPVVVDAGAAANRQQFLADVFALVEPTDIRWVFISHDDVDHTGNLDALMAEAPNATLVVNWFITERMGSSLQVPPTRQRWVGDGQGLDVGDRTLRTIRPPVYDSPTTRGLYDPATGVYWASDGFATPMLQPVRDVHELDVDFWSHGINTFDRYLSPWLDIVDTARFQGTVDRVEALAPTVIAGCHTPAITGQRVGAALHSTRRSATAHVEPQPDQAVLEQIQRTLTAIAA